MRVIRRRNADEIHPFIVTSGRFTVDEFLIRPVGPFGSNIVSRRRRLGSLRVRRQCAGNQLGTVIKNRGRRMHSSNERTLATTHQGHSQLSAQCSVCRLHRDPLLFSGTFAGCGCVNRPRDYNSPRPITTYAVGPAENLIWLSRLKPVRLAPSGSGRVRRVAAC